MCPYFFTPIACCPSFVNRKHCANSLFSQCYNIYVGNDSKKWQEARTFCQSQGGNLVSVLSQGEQGEHSSDVLLICPSWFSAKVDFILQWMILNQKSFQLAFTFNYLYSKAFSLDPLLLFFREEGLLMGEYWTDNIARDLFWCAWEDDLLWRDLRNPTVVYS